MVTYADSAPRPDPTLAHRRARHEIQLLDAAGLPLAEAGVTVEMTRHAFGFGCIGFDFVGHTDELATLRPGPLTTLAELWLDVFNWATLPFYWGQFEAVQGEPNTAALRAAATWFADRGVRVKGHPLVWHTLAPRWLAQAPLDEVERRVRERIRRDVSGFAGLVDTWDAINEVVIMPVFDKEDNAITRLARRIGRIGIIRLAFEEARAANPAATLLLNDFDLSTAYDTLLEGALEAGVRVDALGLQSHMHQGWWGEDHTAEVLDRFARYGLPLHFTETTLVSGDLMPAEIEDLNDHVVDSWPSTPEGEQRQADELERHYRTLFAHPSVASVTYWGLTDAGAWLGAPAGLVRADGTPKPAYDRLRHLVRDEWWTPPAHPRTDAEGRVQIEGFLGDYVVRSAAGSASFTLSPDAAPPTLRLR